MHLPRPVIVHRLGDGRVAGYWLVACCVVAGCSGEALRAQTASSGAPFVVPAWSYPAPPPAPPGAPFKTGRRSTPASLPMSDVAAKLSLGDMIAVAAYEGSLQP